MKIVDVDKLPHSAGVVIPESGFGIFGERCEVVKLEDLMSIEDRCCGTCGNTFSLDEEGCHCWMMGGKLEYTDYCSKWEKK